MPIALGVLCALAFARTAVALPMASCPDIATNDTFVLEACKLVAINLPLP